MDMWHKLGMRCYLPMIQTLYMSDGQKMAANQGIRAGKGFASAIFGKLK